VDLSNKTDAYGLSGPKEFRVGGLTTVKEYGLDEYGRKGSITYYFFTAITSVV
jgi:hypothetical protein